MISPLPPTSNCRGGGGGSWTLDCMRFRAIDDFFLKRNAEVGKVGHIRSGAHAPRSPQLLRLMQTCTLPTIPCLSCPPQGCHSDYTPNQASASSLLSCSVLFLPELHQPTTTVQQDGGPTASEAPEPRHIRSGDPFESVRQPTCPSKRSLCGT